MRIAVAGLLLLVLLATNDARAGGECARDFWGACNTQTWRPRLQYRHCAQDFWGRCADGHPRWRQVERDRGGGTNAIDRGVFCHPRRRVVGTEEKTRERARYAADDAWMGAVRYDHGERFQDLNHARDVRHNCDLSSKTPFLAKARFRCVVEATPCRAPTGTHEERTERRYEEEGEDDRRGSR